MDIYVDNLFEVFSDYFFGTADWKLNYLVKEV